MIKGLVISAAEENDKSAYTHRVKMLAKGLTDKGIHCDFFFMPDNPPLNTETTASVFMPFWLSKLRSYDFIYCGGEESAQSLFFCKPFLNGRVIVDIHGDLIAQSALHNELTSNGSKTSASPRVRMIDHMGKTVADHFLTVCTPQLNVLISNGVAAEKSSLIRNGVDLEQFKPLDYLESPEFAFAYVGEFQVWQGIDNLISAFELLDPGCGKMLLIGFREADQVIKKLLKDKFAERVKLVDRVDRGRLMALLRSVALLMIPRKAHPAIKHAFPTKFAEYAALGRAIIVNNVDETADFVRDYNCGFVSEAAPADMAEVMMAASKTPVSELSAMGHRARRMAEENFSWPKIWSDYFETVTRLISQNH